MEFWLCFYGSEGFLLRTARQHQIASLIKFDMVINTPIWQRINEWQLNSWRTWKRVVGFTGFYYSSGIRLVGGGWAGVGWGVAGVGVDRKGNRRFGSAQLLAYPVPAERRGVRISLFRGAWGKQQYPAAVYLIRQSDNPRKYMLPPTKWVQIRI